MLKRSSSLAFRAAIVFGLTLAGILLTIMSLNALLTGGEGDRRGAHFAVAYASSEAEIVDGELTIRPTGKLAQLLSENPSMWLIALQDGRTYEVGAVTPAARDAFARTAGLVETARIRLPGLAIPEGLGVIEEREWASGPVTLGIGGVDPETLPGESGLSFFWGPETLLTLIIISTISLIAMAVAVPFFTRAVKPIAREAEAIGPQTPGRRLGEDDTPKELLPLVRGINSVLDRLDDELARRKRFISDAAHELRTPLAVVALQVESLPECDQKDQLHQGVKRLTDLVTQMLDLQRLSMAKTSFEAIDLAKLTRSVVADLAPMAIAKGCELALEAPDTPVGVAGNALAIERALSNLISNAIIHCYDGGHISVEVTADRIVTVADDGPGIEEGLHDRIFDPFWQGNQSAGGCGLGLHLTREIMAAHGGKACLMSSPKGAAFRLSFPAAVSPIV